MLNKKYILIFALILLPFSVYAGVAILGGGVSSTSCDDCSGDLMWSAHFEGTGAVGTPFDVTTGSPCGCVDTDGDKTLTYYSDMVNSTDQKTDGLYSLYRAGASDYAQSSITNFNTSAMSISFDVYVSTFVHADPIIYIRDVALNNYIFVSMYTVTTNKFRLTYCGATVTQVITDTNTFSTGQWYTIHAQFRTASSPYLRLKVSDNSATTGTTALEAMNGTPIQLKPGNSLTGASVYYIDNLKVYTGWQTGAEWGD